MSKEMIFNCSDYETRVAVLENKVLSNLFIEKKEEKSIVGNIYIGKVVRVLPGMQAAFVNIGLDRAAFLYVADACYDFADIDLLMSEDDDLGDYSKKRPLKACTSSISIDDILKEGQEVLVQVSKEPIGNKGARITTHISLPGRNLVFMPTLNHIGISRKIKDENERKRLQEIIEGLSMEGYGFIARTVSEKKGADELRSDFEYLLRLWENIKRKKTNAGVFELIHKELDITLRAIRDLYNETFSRIVVDSQEGYHKIAEFMGTFLPDVKYNLELYDKKEPVFDAFGIELEINKMLNKKVWLKSGGYIVIEETEAFCAIDVNTGKYVGKRDLEETILKTNLEAATEIAYQLQVRNIGGIIIIDFIDMEDESNREKVFNILNEHLEKDRNKTNIQKISELGLIEMTRQRTGKSLARILCEPCPYCDGKGIIKSKLTVCYEIFRELEREKSDHISQAIGILAHPEVANILFEDEKSFIEKLEKRLNKKIYIKVDRGFHQEYFEIFPMH